MLNDLQNHGDGSEVECASMRSLIVSLQSDIRDTREHCQFLQEKNSALQSGQPASPSWHAPELEDTLAQQLRQQMETLLQEKAKLASENIRLSRDNQSLQQLLEYRFTDEEEPLTVERSSVATSDHNETCRVAPAVSLNGELNGIDRTLQTVTLNPMRRSGSPGEVR